MKDADVTYARLKGVYLVAANTGWLYDSYRFLPISPTGRSHI